MARRQYPRCATLYPADLHYHILTPADGGRSPGVYCAHHNVQHLLYLLYVGAYAAHPVRTMYVGYRELLGHTTRGRSNGAGLNVLARHISTITSPASLAIAGRKVLYTIRFTGRVLRGDGQKTFPDRGIISDVGDGPGGRYVGAV
jgi:hypothetical protein